MKTHTVVLDEYDQVTIMWRGKQYMTLRMENALTPVLRVGPMSILQDSPSPIPGIVRALTEEGLLEDA